MKKIILLLVALICCFTSNLKTSFADEVIQVRVIYSTINVYSSDNITSSEKIATLKYNDIVTVIQESIGVDGYEYFLIQISGIQNYTQGYVFKSQVLDASLLSPAKKLDSNASIKEECDIYTLDGKNYVLTNTKLSSGTKIKILSGYNASNEYTQIQYADENERIITAYVKTSAIAVSGISTKLIGAIIIIVTSVSLVLIIFGIGKKKVKKK